MRKIYTDDELEKMEYKEKLDAIIKECGDLYDTVISEAFNGSSNRFKIALVDFNEFMMDINQGVRDNDEYKKNMA